MIYGLFVYTKISFLEKYKLWTIVMQQYIWIWSWDSFILHLVTFLLVKSLEFELSIF